MAAVDTTPATSAAMTETTPSTISAIPETNTSTPRSRNRSFFIALCTCSTSLITAMASQSVLLNLPMMGEDLKISQEDLTWILNSYTVAFGCLLLLSGRIADIISRKYTYILGLFLFALFTLCCGFINSDRQVALFVLRALAGVGASMATPSAIGLIAENFEEGRTRSICYACYGAGAPVGAAVGVVMGGLLAEYVDNGWRKVFYILFAAALVPCIGAYWAIPSTRPNPNADKRIDFLGAALVTGGLVILLYAMTAGSTAPQGFKTSYIIAMLVISVFLLGAFITWQWYIENKLHRPPLMRLALFTRGKGRLAVVYAFIFFNFAAFIGYFLLTDLFYQQYRELSPAHTMLHFLPTSVSGVVCNIIVAVLVQHVSGQILLCAGALLTALAPLLFALVKPGSSYWTYEFFAMIFCVGGADFSVATGLIFISRLALPTEQSVGGGLFQTFIQLGSAMGTTIATLVYTSVAQNKANDAGAAVTTIGQSGFPKDAFLSGLQSAFWTGFAMALTALLLAAVFLRGMGSVEGRKRSVDEESVTLPIETTIEDKSAGKDTTSNANETIPVLEKDT